MSNTLPRISSRDRYGLPKTMTAEQFLRQLDGDDQASNQARVVGLVVDQGSVCLLWTHKCLVRALPLSKIDEKAKARLAKLLPPDDVRVIDEYLKRDKSGEYETIKAKALAEHNANADNGF